MKAIYYHNSFILDNQEISKKTECKHFFLNYLELDYQRFYSIAQLQFFLKSHGYGLPYLLQYLVAAAHAFEKHHIIVEEWQEKEGIQSEEYISSRKLKTLVEIAEKTSPIGIIKYVINPIRETITY